MSIVVAALTSRTAVTNLIVLFGVVDNVESIEIKLLFVLRNVQLLEEKFLLMFVYFV